MTLHINAMKNAHRKLLISNLIQMNALKNAIIRLIIKRKNVLWTAHMLKNGQKAKMKKYIVWMNVTLKLEYSFQGKNVLNHVIHQNP